MKKETRIVFDTNIWVSYFISKRFEELAKLILDKNITVFSTTELVEELKEVLSRPKFKNQITLPIERYINFHLQLVTFVSIKKVFTESPDPKDNFLYDLAFQTKSKLLVTGDRKLLLFEVNDLETISLASFKTRFKHT